MDNIMKKNVHFQFLINFTRTIRMVIKLESFKFISR